jgi:dihydrofolate reductase
MSTHQNNLSIIVAMTNNNIIGLNNKMPWHIPADLKYFKQITENNTVIMGSKTFLSIGKPLPNRLNIVLTKDPHKFPETNNTIFTNQIDNLISTLPQDKKTFIIGGSEIFKIFLPIVNNLYITKINYTCHGDRFFPEIKEDEWEIFSHIEMPKNNETPYDLSFLIYKRKI